MAYGNWGAEVWCSGMACPALCDVDPYKLMGKSSPGGYGNMQHAVVGDKQAGILVCLYKHAPFYDSFVIGSRGGMKPVKVNIPDGLIWDGGEVTVNIGGIDVLFEFSDDGNKCWCSCTDKIGREWSASCGIYHGEGYTDWYSPAQVHPDHKERPND